MTTTIVKSSLLHDLRFIFLDHKLALNISRSFPCQFSTLCIYFIKRNKNSKILSLCQQMLVYCISFFIFCVCLVLKLFRAVIVYIYYFCALLSVVHFNNLLWFRIFKKKKIGQPLCVASPGCSTLSDVFQCATLLTT